MISNKFKWVIGLSLVFILILTTNIVDRNNFKRIKSSIVNIYEDRLVAKNLIFKLYVLLEDKSLAIAAKDTSFFSQRNLQVNTEIEEIIVKFRQTRLTTKEAATLGSFETDFRKLLEIEQASDQSKIKAQIGKLKEDLHTLSAIQLAEGKRQLDIGAQAANSVELLTRLEIIMLIILAAIVQLILIYTPKKEK